VETAGKTIKKAPGDRPRGEGRNPKLGTKKQFIANQGVVRGGESSSLTRTKKKTSARPPRGENERCNLGSKIKNKEREMAIVKRLRVKSRAAPKTTNLPKDQK